jgi:Undecaprenyl-phosphate galactose phosphotransferase WbaP
MSDKTRRSRDDATWVIIIALLVSDLFAVFAAFCLSFLTRQWFPFLPRLMHGFELYLSAWPLIFLWLFLFWREKLYPGLWHTRGEELRRTVIASTLAGLLVMSATFVTKTGQQYSRPIIVGGWLLSLALVPACRFMMKRLATRLGLSGPRTVVLGAGLTARIFLDGLGRQHPPALTPVALFDDDPGKLGSKVAGVEVVADLEQAPDWALRRGIRTAIIAMPGVRRELLIPMIERHSRFFPRIIVVPDLFGLSSMDVETLQIQGILALEIRKNLLYRHNRVAKRAIDVLLLLVAAPFVLVVGAVISFGILVESGRPVLFTQKRIGRSGLRFLAWKYRTMVNNAEHVLDRYLQERPELRKEWEASQKLKDDPRLTRVGRILRRLSLDELPQFWNILRGEMSLVGPRPIVEEEIAKYGASYDLYTQVLPGLTGLWQVSGRSDLRYEDRVWLDTHYVRNWSIWLDLVILVRTVWVVIAGVGAY